MKRLFSFLMVTVLVVSMLTATAFAADAPTATLTVTGMPTEVETDQEITLTFTITGDSKPMGGATVSITATGLEHVGHKGQLGVTCGPETWTFAADDDNAQKSVSCTYTFKVTANSGEVSIKLTATASDTEVNGLTHFTVKEASATATVKAAETEPTPPTVDKTKLEAAIAEAEKVDETEYTAESVAALKAALEEAQKVYDDEKATQAEVDAAQTKLAAALELVPKETEPSEGDDEPSGWWPGQDYQPGTSSKPTAPTTTPEKDEVPKTADATTQVWPLAVMMVLSAAGVAVLVRKRNGK